MSDRIVITQQMLDDLVAETEGTPPDLSPEVKVDDWVRFDLPGLMAYYQSGHVTEVRPRSHLVRLGYGARDDEEFRWTYNGYTDADAPIVEHWRKVGRVVREGNSITVDSDWVQIPLAGAP